MSEEGVKEICFVSKNWFRLLRNNCTIVARIGIAVIRHEFHIIYFWLLTDFNMPLKHNNFFFPESDATGNTYPRVVTCVIITIMRISPQLFFGLAIVTIRNLKLKSNSLVSRSKAD